MLATGQIALDRILGMTAPLPNWKQAFDAMQQGEVVKAVLVP